MVWAESAIFRVCKKESWERQVGCGEKIEQRAVYGEESKRERERGDSIYLMGVIDPPTPFVGVKS